MDTKLGLGTSVLSNGYLVQGIDENERIQILIKAINHGIKHVHTNPRLGTQQALKKAITICKEDIYLYIKTEATIQDAQNRNMQAITWRINKTLKAFPESNVAAVICEIDHKKSNQQAISRIDEINRFIEYSHYAINQLMGKNSVPLYFMCKSKQEYTVANNNNSVDGLAGYCNLYALGFLAEIITETPSKPCIGFSPFHRKRLFSKEVYKIPGILDSVRTVIGRRREASIAKNSALAETSLLLGVKCPGLKRLFVSLNTQSQLAAAIEVEKRIITWEKICEAIGYIQQNEYYWS